MRRGGGGGGRKVMIGIIISENDYNCGLPLSKFEGIEPGPFTTVLRYCTVVYDIEDSSVAL